MRVALIKQALDVFGPWSSIRWKDIDPVRLLDFWPSKATLWEMTCLLEADWYIISEVIELDYHRDLFARYPKIRELVAKYVTNVVSPEEIPFSEYDVVITLDPVLSKFKSSRTLMAYYMNEHWDELYRRSLKRPVGKYDIFLAHMMDSEQDVSSIPQAISFPYLRAPEKTRSLFDSEKEETIWVDWRTLTMLGMTDFWNSESEKAAERLHDLLKIPISYYGGFNKNPYGVTDPPKWGDAANYLKKVSRCKYYVSVGRFPGAGQGVCDAASLACICIGQRNKAYHQLVCHPECLCADMAEMPRKVQRVVSSPALQAEILGWQDEAIDKFFVKKPLEIFREAMDIKSKNIHFC